MTLSMSLPDTRCRLVDYCTLISPLETDRVQDSLIIDGFQSGEKMLVVFLIIFAAGLLGAIVVGLHKHQRKELVSNVDRQSPLPPLDAGVVSKFSVLTPELPVQKTAELPTDPSRSWIQECNEFKNKDMFTEALEICQLHFPQWGAFNLACTVLRANIRSDIKNDRDIDRLLQQLFRVAACASFLHDKSSDLPSLSQRQLKQLPVSAWQALEMPFDKIGYTELRLLGKADHRLIRATWGEPAHNISARHYHRDSWLRLIKVYGDTPVDIPE